jgi:hypothetical protein
LDIFDEKSVWQEVFQQEMRPLLQTKKTTSRKIKPEIGCMFKSDFNNMQTEISFVSRVCFLLCRSFICAVTK